MQTIYAFKRGEGDNFKADETFLVRSMDNMYTLYLLLLSLLIEVQLYTENYVSKTQRKHLATKDDKNPNKKFANNEVLQRLKSNPLLIDAFEKNHIANWKLDNEYVDIIFKEIINSELFKDYMQTRTSNFVEDKNFITDVYKDIIAPNEKLYDYLEDQNLTWVDDLPVINTAILKLIRKLKANSPETHFLPQLYKDHDDKDFAMELFKKTILNQTTLSKAIAEKTKNWDSERIATIDNVLLKMAVCELNNFPSIPVKVTINEYLEIAKEYSTPKSSIFINGILDNLVKEYQESGTLNKIGRGLM